MSASAKSGLVQCSNRPQPLLQEIANFRQQLAWAPLVFAKLKLYPGFPHGMDQKEVRRCHTI
jgi:hypothetical protein